MSGYRVVVGDCREVMAGMEAGSVDAIVTDPPYGLSFMGKSWDHAVPGPAYFEAMLRVLKPGGYLLAFAGTRTYHRMAVSIEDAGFEIRDQVLWLYGQGFPKGLNVSEKLRGTVCSCGGSTVPYDHTKEAEPSPERDLRSVRDTDVPTPVDAGEERGQVLLPCVPEQGAPATGRPEPSSDARAGQPGVEGRSDAVQKEGELQEHSLRSGAEVGEADGEGRRVHHGAPANNGEDGRSAAETDRGSTPQGSRPREQRPRQPRALAEQQRAQESRAWPLCDRCGQPCVPDGLGTALKPSVEPICVARKPFDGAVAGNVLRHGTGALNIDACRIPGVKEGDPNRFVDTKKGGRITYAQDEWTKENFVGQPIDPNTGRWPANVVLDEAAAELLDEQSGTLQSGSAPDTGFVRHSDKTRNAYGTFRGNREEPTVLYGDTGGASRFFYVAKASRAERNRGCEHFYWRRDPDASIGHVRVGRDEWESLDPKERARGNIHPTVKPLSLAKWLVRLVTPPGGTVLDPFAGSFTTGVACVEEGFGVVLIERERPYADIGEARVNASEPSLFSSANVTDDAA